MKVTVGVPGRRGGMGICSINIIVLIFRSFDLRILGTFQEDSKRNLYPKPELLNPKL